MHSKGRLHTPTLRMRWSPESAVLAIMIPLLCLLLALLFIFITAQPLQGQTFSVIHSFNGSDGEYPAGLTIDAAGNLYGVTYYSSTAGNVFKLSRAGSGWVFTVLYSFQGGSDGSMPNSGLIFGPDGKLYGTTTTGGGQQCSGAGCGTVFALKPPPQACRTVSCPWIETLLYRFTGGLDGCNANGNLLFDRYGNLDGTTAGCGSAGGGTVFQLHPADGGWTLSVLHSFAWGTDGASPSGGLISDSSGTLYGVTQYAGSPGNHGIVYELTPSGSGFIETVLHAFQGTPDGGCPIGGLMWDGSGNMYGTTSSRGSGGDGTTFELTASGGVWGFSLLYSFVGSGGFGPCGPGSATNLVMDLSGNLYGSLESAGAYQNGNVFKLTASNGGWVYNSMHDFIGDDGMFPWSSLVIDRGGNIYGTTIYGGAYGAGVVFEVTP